MKVVFHGHSFVEIERDSGSILIDPFISGNPKCDLSLEQVLDKKISHILVTHAHQDHLGDTVEIANKTEAQIVCSFEVANYLKSEHGLSDIHAMATGGEHKFDDFSVKLFQAMHGGGVEGSVANGFIIRINDKTIYHAGDTGLMTDMKLLGEYENIDLAFLPVGDNFTMGTKDAVIATEFINPKVVVPMHYDTWPVIEAEAIEFARLIMTQGKGVVPKVLQPGQYMAY